MQAENNSQKKVSSKISSKKVLLWMLFFLCIFFVFLFFAVPVYLSSESGKNLIVGKINSFIDGKVQVENFSMGWFAGIKADNLNFTSSSGTTKLTAEQIAARPSYLALLGGKVEIDEAVIAKPDVSVTIGDRQLTGKAATATGQVEMKSAAPVFPINRLDLTINRGNFKIIAPNANQAMQMLELRDINSKLALRPLGSKSSFDISMAIASANEVSDISDDRLCQV